MFEFLITGVILGFYTGFSPGPIVLLVIAQTLRYGRNEGLKISFATIIADLPVIFIALFLLSIISTNILGLISILGGFYVIYLAYECFKTKEFKKDVFISEKPKSLLKGISLNLLTPAPYIFWITIIGPIIISASRTSLSSSILFITSFYTILISTKIILVYVSAKSREFITGKPYIYVMRILGILLLIFAFYLINTGLYESFHI